MDCQHGWCQVEVFSWGCRFAFSPALAFSWYMREEKGGREREGEGSHKCCGCDFRVQTSNRSDPAVEFLRAFLTGEHGACPGPRDG